MGGISPSLVTGSEEEAEGVSRPSLPCGAAVLTGFDLVGVFMAAKAALAASTGSEGDEDVGSCLGREGGGLGSSCLGGGALGLVDDTSFFLTIAGCMGEDEAEEEGTSDVSPMAVSAWTSLELGPFN